MTEILNCMKIIKLYGWEESFLKSTTGNMSGSAWKGLFWGDTHILCFAFLKQFVNAKDRIWRKWCFCRVLVTHCPTLFRLWQQLYLLLLVLH